MCVPDPIGSRWGRRHYKNNILQNFPLSTETLYLAIQRYIYTCTKDPAGHCNRSYCIGHGFWFPPILLRGEGNGVQIELDGSLGVFREGVDRRNIG